ncbi:hypothetical protein D3C80_1550790 [compost metagenome]
MAEHDGIDAWHLAEVVHRVFRHGLIGVAGKARVGDRDDQIGPLLTHFRYVAFGGFGDVVDGHFPLQVGFVPHQDLRRHKADIADT